MSVRATLLLACLGSPWMGNAMFGQSVVPPGTPQNIAAISFSAAVMQTNEARRDFAALQNKFAPRQKQLEALSSEIDNLRKQFNDLKEQLSDSELNARTQALAAKQKQLERTEEDFRNDSQSDGEQAFRRIEQKMFEFLQVFAHDHGYTMVIDRGTENTPIVMYSTQNADITNEVVSAYNAKSGIPAPPANDSNSRAPAPSSLNAPQPAPHRP